MNNPLINALQEAREYYQNKPRKYNLTPEQLEQLDGHLTGKPSIGDELEQPGRVSYPSPSQNY